MIIELSSLDDNPRPFELSFSGEEIDLDVEGAKLVGQVAAKGEVSKRIAQTDILDFCINPNYKELKWPDEYWPKNPAPPDDAAWKESIAGYRRDSETLKNLIADPARDLHARIPHGDGQTLFREALLVVDHNSYHLGQLVFVRQLLGIWPPRK